jgi:hypothetical protein
MFDFASLWELAQSQGLAGVVIALVVLVVVYILAYTGLLKDGTWKRYAVIIAAALFAGVPAGTEESAVRGAIALILSTLLKLVIDGVQKEVAARAKK